MGKYLRIVAVGNGTTGVRFAQQLLNFLQSCKASSTPINKEIRFFGIGRDGGTFDPDNMATRIASSNIVDRIIQAQKNLTLIRHECLEYGLTSSSQYENEIEANLSDLRDQLKELSSHNSNSLLLMNLTTEGLWEESQFSLFLKSLGMLEEPYVPRYLYGVFQQYYSRYIINELNHIKGINTVGSIPGNIVKISYNENLGKWVITYQDTSSNHSTKSADIIHIGLGCLFAPAYPQIISPYYILNASGLTNEQIKILPDPKLNSIVKIGILGTRLSFVDVALQLQGLDVAAIEIVGFSPSGFVPHVKAEHTVRLDFEWDREKIKTLSAAFERLKEILAEQLNIEKKEIEAIIERKLNKIQARKSTYKDVTSICAKHLKSEIDAAKGKRRVWMEVMEFFYFKLQELFITISPEEAKEFYDKWEGVWRLFQIGIPIVSAEKILAMIKKGILKIVSGLINVTIDGDGKIILWFADGRIEKVDYLIDATGPKRLTQETRYLAPYLDKLFEQGILTLHPNGGVKFDPKTMHPIDKNGHPVKTITVSGYLTGGQCLGPHDVDSVYELTRCAAQVFHEHLLPDEAPEPSPPMFSLGSPSSHSETPTDQLQLEEKSQRWMQIAMESGENSQIISEKPREKDRKRSHTSSTMFQPEKRNRDNDSELDEELNRNDIASPELKF